MAAPSQSTCAPWADIGDVCSPCDDYEMDTAALADWIQVASDVLFDLTGRRWPGTCSTTVRPCGIRSARRDGWTGWDWCGCFRSETCSCRRLSQLELPGPIAGVTAVKIDGVTLDPARYRIDDHRWLVYIPAGDDDPRRGWPCCQRLDLADTETDTWSIAYEYGTDPPLGGRLHAATLGCQFALACQPETTAGAGGSLCRLPANVVNETRQGVTIALADPAALIANGQTGLPEVDLWVASVNRGRAMRPATVWAPGQQRTTIRRTGT